MEKFNVYKGTPSAQYSGGCLLIAARNINEAYSLLTEMPSDMSMDDHPHYFYGYTEIDYLTLVPDLYCQCNKPHVIMAELYVE